MNLIMTKEFWVVAATLATLLASLFARYLSKRAQRIREQQKEYELSSQKEESQLTREAAEVVVANEIIELQKQAEEDWFRSAMKNPFSGSIWVEICKAATDHGLDHSIVGAVCMVESTGNPWAIRFENHWKHFLNVKEFARGIAASEKSEEIAQMTSWGLMQVMGAVARELGHKTWISELCDPAVGLRYGCLKLKQTIGRHGLEAGLAAYNAGTPRKTESGAFVNQEYVDRILRWHKELQELTKIS